MHKLNGLFGQYIIIIINNRNLIFYGRAQSGFWLAAPYMREANKWEERT